MQQPGASIAQASAGLRRIGRKTEVPTLPKLIPEKECIDKLNSLLNKKFVRWIDKYSNSRSIAVMRCDIDGHEWTATPFNLIHSGSGCPKCSGNYRYTETERINQINSIDGISFIRWDGEYTGRASSSMAVVRCLIDGNEWSASVDSLVNGKKGCPKCGGVYRYSEVERIKQINDMENISFVRWDSNYKNNFSKAVVACECGHEWVVTVRDLVSGRRCPRCAVSGFNTSKSGVIYALRSECGMFIKVGISNKKDKRIKKLKNSTPFSFDVIDIYRSDDGKEIARLEKEFHRKYESAGFAGFDGATEWLKFTPELLEEFRKLGVNHDNRKGNAS